MPRRGILALDRLSRAGAGWLVPDLVVASILSKTLASGTDALVLDVETGSGAVMRDEACRAQARRTPARRRLDCGVVALGGGRRRPDQAIDHAVGLVEVLGRGDRARAGEPLAVKHARAPLTAEVATAGVAAAFTIDATALESAALYGWLPDVALPEGRQGA